MKQYKQFSVSEKQKILDYIKTSGEAFMLETDIGGKLWWELTKYLHSEGFDLIQKPNRFDDAAGPRTLLLVEPEPYDSRKYLFSACD